MKHTKNMKKWLKIVLFIIIGLLIIIFGIFCMLAVSVKNVKLDENKLININNSIVYYDVYNNVLKENGVINNSVSIDQLPDHVKNAFISIEDKRFYSHNGVDYKALTRAMFRNLKSGFLKEGGSTISQQLIKNTHLSNEKTFKRKLSEIKLAKQLEKKFTKNEILEKYLNTIYFGDNCYGIDNASNYYFNKSAKNLTINESASLAGCIKAPSHYSPTANEEKNFNRKNIVLEQMYNQGYITKQEFEDNVTKKVMVNIQEKNGYDALDLIKSEVNEFINENLYGKGKIHIYTSIDPKIQEKLENTINNIDIKSDKTAVILNKNNQILAYYSTVKDDNRQLGSTIKPILVYAPAIETGTVDSCSFINDEKTDFNGYSPSNYNEIYYGQVTVKESLAKSLNICSAKIMNLTGVENCINYAKKTDVVFTENDFNLSSALGATEKGATLTQITSAYNVFINKGFFTTPTCIFNIRQESLQKNFEQEKRQIFSDDTCYIVNDMLRYTVSNGTAKQLSYNDFPICAKTGTVGNKNGNTDAYCISYTNDYIVGVRFSNKKDTIMSNSITGGNMPSIISSEIWNDLYDNSTPTKFEECSSVRKIYIDKISFDKDKIIEIADSNAPKRYTQLELFTKNSSNKNISTRFTSPKIEKPNLLVNSNGICIRLCLTEYYEYLIYKAENGLKEKIYDSNMQGKFSEFIDKEILPNTEYSYSIIPYFKGKNQTFYGDEIYLNKIKTPANEIAGEDWWSDELN